MRILALVSLFISSSLMGGEQSQRTISATEVRFQRKLSAYVKVPLVKKVKVSSTVELRYKVKAKKEPTLK